MHETVWLPAIVVLLAGLLIGVAAALVLFVKAKKRGQSARHAPARVGSPADQRVDDLRSRKEQLLEQLRDLEDTGAATEQERAELERQAATVLRDLADAEGSGGAAQARHSGATGAPAARSEMRGALKGALAVAVIALVGFALWRGVRPRTEGMGITGNDSVGQVEGSSQGGGAEASGLQPQETPRLRQARAAVQAAPESIDALIELGYALAEAGGWTDLYSNTQEILERDPNNADALIQSAMLRFAMGQPQQADALIDRVLHMEPNNLRALEVGGRLALHTESWARAEKLLSTAIAKIGPGSGFEPLRERARQQAALAGTAASERSGQGPGSASARGKAVSDRSGQGAERTSASSALQRSPAPGGSAAATEAISGTVKLSDGVDRPSGGVLFVMARPAGAEAGPPIAVIRLPATGFPRAFRLDRSHAMMGAALPAKVALSARLDADGNVATKQPQDLVGGAAAAVGLGSDGVEIVLAPAGG
jgi:cytochrome c-type biogenesis protein CcmH